jgi:hypothetical protein
LFCIAQQPGLQLVDDNIHFSNPEHNPYNDKNTRVTVSYTDTYVHVPTRVLHYNRLDVAEFFSEVGEPSLNISSSATVQQTLDAILARYDVAFDLSDITLPLLDGDYANLNASANSLGWTGTVSFRLASSNFSLDNGDPFELDDGTFFEFVDEPLEE